MNRRVIFRVVGIFLLSLIVVGVTMTQPRQAHAGTARWVTLILYKSPTVTDSDSTLKDIGTRAIENIKKAVSPKGIDLSYQVKGPYYRSYYGCEPSHATGWRNFGVAALTFYKGQLGHNGYACQGCADAYAMVDQRPTWGICPLLTETCTGSKTCNWSDVVAATHELGHVFNADHCSSDLYNDSDDLCGKTCGQMCLGKFCVMEYSSAGLGTQSFCDKDATKMTNYFKNVWLRTAP